MHQRVRKRRVTEPRAKQCCRYNRAETSVSTSGKVARQHWCSLALNGLSVLGSRSRGEKTNVMAPLTPSYFRFQLVYYRQTHHTVRLEVAALPCCRSPKHRPLQVSYSHKHWSYYVLLSIEGLQSGLTHSANIEFTPLT